MNKTIKKIIVVFTILCAVLLLVFSVELILVNRDSGTGDAEPSLSGSQPLGNGGNSDADPGTPEANPSGTSGSNGETTTSNDPPPPPPTGTRFERLMPDDVNLVFYVDGELFEHSETELEDILDVFRFKGGGTAGLEIRFVFMPQGVNTYADNFLEVNFNVSDSASHGEETIKRSRLRGVFASGTSDGTTYEAWIYTFSNPEFDNLGVSFIINFQNETQRSALYSVLDSLEMV